MSKGIYWGGGTSRKVKQVYIGNGNTARKVVKAYIGVNGVAKQFWPSVYTWIKYEITKPATLKGSTSYGNFRSPISRVAWGKRTLDDGIPTTVYKDTRFGASFNIDDWEFVNGFPTASFITTTVMEYDDPKVYQSAASTALGGYIDGSYSYSVDEEKNESGYYDIDINLIPDNAISTTSELEFVVVNLTRRWSARAYYGTIYYYEISKTTERIEVGTVTSDDPNAYPEDGMHTDGYWYTKQ